MIKRFGALVERTRSRRHGISSLVQSGSREPSELAAQISLGRDTAESRLPSTILAQPGARSDIHESLRHLQSRIFSTLPEDGHAVIAVCSALEGEGKTTVAVALAEMLSEQFHRQILLVDANLNRPQLHTLLDTQASPGFQDCLSAGSLMTSAIGWDGRMWVMPVGAHPSQVSDGPGDPRDLFRTLRSLFRITIVDLPAVSAHLTAALLPFWADQVVWVVKADYAPTHVVADSMDLVERDKIIGVVLNGQKSRLPGWLDRLL